MNEPRDLPPVSLHGVVQLDDWTKPEPKPKSLADIPEDKIEKIPYVEIKRKKKRKRFHSYRHLTRIGRVQDDF